MSDRAHPGRKALEAWRANQAENRRAATQVSDAWIGGWTVLLLIATLLYLLIGNTPYQHELLYDPLTGGTIMSPVNRYFWLGLLAMAMPVLIFRYETLPQFAGRLWPLMLLFVWFAATTRWALDPEASQRRLFQIMVGLIICLAVRVGLPDGRRVHSAMAWACAIVIIIDLVSWIVAPAASMTELGLAAIHNHKNTLGLVMLFSSLVLAPYVFGRPTLTGRMVWGGVYLGCLVLLVASRSKTSMALVAVAALATPLLLAVLSLRKPLLVSIAVILGTVLAAAGFGWLAWSFVQGLDPLAPLYQLNFTRRTDVWQFVIQQFLHHPIRGVGFGSFWDVDPAVQPSKQTDLWFAQPNSPTNQAHNGYLDLLVTVGLPGLVGALLLLFGWMLGGLALIREMRLSPALADGRLPYAIFLGMFPLMFFVHNWMESSYFAADSTYGLIIMLVGITIDTRDRPPVAIRR